ncbi:MAG: hypothetical protein Q4P24_05110 [Rhodobacterales bacterium]|nr:hypothetical protein [Rhodobacterales bacterium]
MQFDLLILQNLPDGILMRKLTAADQMLLQTGRYDLDDDEKLKLRYTAIDPMDRYVRCGCGKPGCWTNELRPLREHMTALIRTILSFGYRGLIDGGQNPWPGTFYALHMAVSIEDVFVDPAYIDESDSALYCDPAWEFDEEQREQSAKYVAALSIFNFTWTAYEAAIENALGPEYSNDKIPVQARKFFKVSDEQCWDTMRAFRGSYRVAKQICSRIPDLQGDIELIETKYGLTGAAAAAELVRIFRNHIFHGKDSTPLWGGLAKVSHFYATTRLLLMLIQNLLLLKARDTESDIPLSLVIEEKGNRPARFVLLNLHRPEAQWTPNSTR